VEITERAETELMLHLKYLASVLALDLLLYDPATEIFSTTTIIGADNFASPAVNYLLQIPLPTQRLPPPQPIGGLHVCSGSKHF